MNTPSRTDVSHGKTYRTLRGALAGSILTISALTNSGCVQVIPRADVAIGTANPAEVDYPLGGSICRLLNIETSRHGLRCAEIPSDGYVTNIAYLLNGRFDVAIVPSDFLADAVAGRGSFASLHATKDLRVLFAGHSDVFTLVARRDSGIRTIEDLRGKRIGIGERDTRQNVMMERVIASLGLARADFSKLEAFSTRRQTAAFCDAQLDAIVHAVAHPNGLIRDMALRCGGKLVPIDDPALEKILSDYGEYERVVIRGGNYIGVPMDIQTFGVRAVVVSTVRMPDATAHEITRAVFENFDVFRRLHPAFEKLSISEMVHPSAGAPIHAGAARYFRSRGW